MPSDLNVGYQNNINIIQSRVNGTHSLRYTDRPIDLSGDGVVEKVSITVTSGHAVGTSSAPGGKIRQTVVKPSGIARSIVSQVTETDGGVTSDRDASEYTEGS